MTLGICNSSLGESLYKIHLHFLKEGKGGKKRILRPRSPLSRDLIKIANKLGVTVLPFFLVPILSDARFETEKKLMKT